MNQSDFRENTCRLGQARENACGQILCSRLQDVVIKKSSPKSPLANLHSSYNNKQLSITFGFLSISAF